MMLSCVFCLLGSAFCVSWAVRLLHRDAVPSIVQALYCTARKTFCMRHPGSFSAPGTVRKGALHAVVKLERDGVARRYRCTACGLIEISFHYAVLAQ
jgi:hypothetical protein